MCLVTVSGLSGAQTHVSGYQNRSSAPMSLTVTALALGLFLLMLPLGFYGSKRTNPAAARREDEDNSFQRTCRSWDPRF
jgi:hypothetical protein